MSYKFFLNQIPLVKNFVSMAEDIDGDIEIHSGRYVIDGKSIMGVFSLDLSKELECIIYASEEQTKLFEDGLKKLKLL